MLIRCTVERWEGFPSKVGDCILNTRRMSDVVETSTGSRCKYSSHEGHRRGETDIIFINKSPTEINTASELVPLDDFFQFGVYPDEDITQVSSFISFKIRDIVRMKTSSSVTCSLWIQHNEVRIERYQVLGTLSWHLAEIYSENN